MNTLTPLPIVSKRATPTFGARLATQASVVSALAIHDIRLQSKKAKLGFFWELFQPLSVVAFWFVLYTVLAGPKKIYDMTTFLFLGTGIVGLFLFQDIAQGIPRFVAQQKGFLRFPIIRQVDFLMAGFLKEATVMTLAALLVWGGIVVFGLGFAPAEPVGVIAAGAALALLGWGFGCFNSMVLVLVPLYDKFLPIFFRILFFTSGTIFPLEAVPPRVREYLLWNPVAQGIEQIRSSWSYTFDAVNSSTGYVLLWAAGFMFFALVLDHHGLRARSNS